MRHWRSKRVNFLFEPRIDVRAGLWEGLIWVWGDWYHLVGVIE